MIIKVYFDEYHREKATVWMWMALGNLHSFIEKYFPDIYSFLLHKEYNIDILCEVEKPYRVDGIIFSFDNVNHALLFKLTWG
jgi:hypothetical protein